jgi:uncharacterized membrane protein YqjE
MRRDDDELTSGPRDVALEDLPTADLVRGALDEARELVRIEIEIAKSEVHREVQRAKHAAIALGLAAAAAILVVSSLVLAAVLARGGRPEVALVAAAVFLVLGAGFALAGYTMMPKTPLGHTRKTLESDVRQLKEHIA